MSTGIVVGTYGSIPYIHLQLEQWCRLNAGMKMLIHDDSSPDSSELARLCSEYGADFTSTRKHAGHSSGDVSALLAGLRWAHTHKLTRLIKISRRWIPKESLAGYVDSCMQGKLAAVSLRGFDSGPAVRSEFIVLDVEGWNSERAITALQTYIDNPSEFVELTMVRWLRLLAGGRYEECIDSLDGLLAPHRRIRSPCYLWHFFSPPSEYAELAIKLNLPYVLKDFEGYPEAF